MTDRERDTPDTPDKSGKSLSLVKVGSTLESRRQAVIDLFRQLSGREPTDQELKDMDKVLNKHSSQR